jgi:hypothetical protein
MAGVKLDSDGKLDRLEEDGRVEPDHDGLFLAQAALQPVADL